MMACAPSTLLVYRNPFCLQLQRVLVSEQEGDLPIGGLEYHGGRLNRTSLLSLERMLSCASIWEVNLVARSVREFFLQQS